MSLTLEIWWREVAENIALPPASELALLNDLPNFDCMGLKVDNLCDYFTERDIWSLVLERLYKTFVLNVFLLKKNTA